MSPNSQAFKQIECPLDRIFLDPNNYRFIDDKRYVRVDEKDWLNPRIQERTHALVRGEGLRHIQDLIDSFKKNGYLPVDQIQVREVEGHYMVVEGNRRITTLKHLKERHAAFDDLGALNPSIFDNVPLVLYDDPSEEHFHVLMGLKHISGNKKWPAYNQACLLKDLKDKFGQNDRDIAHAQSITIHELRINLRTLAIIDQFKESVYGDSFEPDMFNVFREIVRSTEIKKWLDWDERNLQAANSLRNEQLFSWLVRVSVDNDTDSEDEDTPGTTGMSQEPIITKGSEVRELARIIHDERAISNLERTRSLTQATLSSDVLGADKAKNAVKIMQDQVNTAFQFAQFMDNETRESLEAIQLKFQALLNTHQGRSELWTAQRQQEPINSLIEHQFKRVSIGQYRRFQGLNLEDLGRINILTGNNNAGKTTLLEVIHLLAHQNDPGTLIEILLRRGKVLGEPDGKWVSGQIRPMKMSGLFDGRETNLSINPFEDENQDKAGYFGSFRFETMHGTLKQSALLHLFTHSRRVGYKSSRVLCRTVFSSPFVSMQLELLKECHEASLQAGTKDKIIAFIKLHLAPDLKYIELNDSRRFIATLESGAVRELTDFGEGMQRVFLTSLLFAYAENGIVLIDELENGIHTSLLTDFTSFICELARLFNVQVFFTSHSKECIDAFFASDNKVDDVCVYTLMESEDKTPIAHRIDGPKFKRLLQVTDFDARLVG